ncbi:hypothetical protein VE00_09619 [Pseudogymnoascus sp. WSF 3629]|nr:hypothetical protein VE00_09619 [Pseudogymnoascus sp. WSF 3629]
MRPAIRTRAVEDAEKAQRGVDERAVRAGEAPPPYVLVELIGKGSYGRVYKGEDTRTREVVAVKIIDIDESDTVSPRYADTYSEFLKEISALKVLSEGRARNINHIIDALPVGKTMWMVTEYCGGGSVATLMRPKPGGLEEKYIIPILREGAEALGWVHRAGIIHRDVKCANILLTTHGSIQLCDFGVAGTLSAATDKRSTFIGTPHWMAPELFTSSSSSSSPSYGVEVDIWAFGAVVYEVATGLPPNASSRVPYGQLGQTAVPRLEGEEYSHQLRDLAAYCLVEDPTKRPTIEQVQLHPFIHNTTLTHPTTTLTDLTTAFRIWEDDGGARASLFMAGGAAGASDTAQPEEKEDGEWDFESTLLASTTDNAGFTAEKERLDKRGKGGRRRPPAAVLAPLRAPIEKVFDPNTLSTYEGNSRAHYFPSPSDRGSDLPLRNRDGGGRREGDADGDETLKPPTRGPGGGVEDAKRRTQEWTFASSLPAPLYDVERGMEGEGGTNRRTKDWTFASSLPAVVDPDDRRSDGYAQTPTLPHQALETHRISTAESLINLDIILPPFPRISSQYPQSRASMAESLIDLDISPPHSPTSPAQQNHIPGRGSVVETLVDIAASPRAPMTPVQYTEEAIPSSTLLSPEQTFSPHATRALPAPPSVEALSGAAGVDVVRSEMGRLLGGLVVELGVVRDVLAGPGVI